VEKATVEDHGSITFFDGMWRKGVTLLWMVYNNSH
jgi:hypothetical protein